MAVTANITVSFGHSDGNAGDDGKEAGMFDHGVSLGCGHEGRGRCGGLGG